MPAPELWGRFHKAVLWRRIGYDRNGQPVVRASGAEEIMVRWDDTFRQVAGKEGTPITIEAVVAIPSTVPIGSLLWKGSIDDLPGTSHTPSSDVMEVHSFNEVPDLKARVSYREANLKRFKDVLGTTK